MPSSTARSAPVDGIILAGGSARRMGGVDKPGLTVGGVSLVQRVVDAASRCRRLVVVGPHRVDLDASVLQVREEPAGSGPVAAIAAGLAALGPDTTDTVVVLAADVPFVDRPLVEALVAATATHPAAFVVDEGGRTQYLLGAWERETLLTAVAGVESVAGAAVRALVPTAHASIRVAGLDDCDTADDLRRARLRAASETSSSTLDFDDARSMIGEALTPMPARSLPVADASGSVLAEPLTAATPLPPVDTSAMDGFAVAGEAPWVVRRDVAYAGVSGLQPLGPGEAVRIATGAAVPAGTSAVVRDEHVERIEGTLVRRPGAPVRDDRRRAGDDWKAGAVLIPSGTAVSAAVVSVALSAERDTLVVRGPVRAQILSSGNEIRTSGALEPGQTRDTIGPVLPRYLQACGIEVTDVVHLEDSQAAFDEALADSGDVDLIVVIGATGGGAADRLRTALAATDAHVVVDRVAIRPGGSQITAVLPSGPVVLGLPGNPLAAIGTALTIAPTIVEALTARRSSSPHLGYLTNAESVSSPVTRIVPVSRRDTRWHAESAVGTAHLLHLTMCDALAVVGPFVTSDTPVELFPLPH